MNIINFNPENIAFQTDIALLFFNILQKLSLPILDYIGIVKFNKTYNFCTYKKLNNLIISFKLNRAFYRGVNKSQLFLPPDAVRASLYAKSKRILRCNYRI